MKPYVKNTIILTVCTLISKFIGALYRIPLSNILGTEGIGLYQMVFPVYSLFLVFITGGMPVYISQRVSFYRAKNDYKSIGSLIKNALLLCFCLALVFTTILILFSRQFSIWQGNQNAFLGYITVAVSILFSSLTCVYRGYFQGLENMLPTAINGIVEQVVKLVVGLGLAYLLKGYGLIYSVSGAFLGVLVSEIISFVYIFAVYKIRHKQSIKSYVNATQIKNIFNQFLPLSLTSLVLPLSSCIDSFLVVNLLVKSRISVATATSLYGIATGMINPLINFPIILCSVVGTAFLPALTYAIAKNEDTKNLTEGTYFFVWLICVPCTFGILALAPNIVRVFFPAVEMVYFDVAVYYLSISAFNIIWMSIMQISTSILNSLGHFKLPLISQTISFFVKLILLIILILYPQINILALCFSTAISEIICSLINLYFVRKKMPINIKIKNLLIPLFGAILMFVCVNFLNNLISVNETIKAVILILIGVLIYFSICFVFRVISLKSIRQLFNNKKNVNKI